MRRTLRSTRPVAAAALLLIAGIAPAARAAEEPASATLRVSESGKHSWSGTLPAPSASGTDGPFATPKRARDEARRLRAADGPTRHGGILKPDNPALKLGFRPPDLSGVGPRDRVARRAEN